MDCSRTCGAGQKRRDRSIAVRSQGEGDECIGRFFEVKKCYLGMCPGYMPDDQIAEFKNWMRDEYGTSQNFTVTIINNQQYNCTYEYPYDEYPEVTTTTPKNRTGNGTRNGTGTGTGNGTGRDAGHGDANDAGPGENDTGYATTTAKFHDRRGAAENYTTKKPAATPVVDKGKRRPKRVCVLLEKPLPLTMLKSANNETKETKKKSLAIRAKAAVTSLVLAVLSVLTSLA